jgi:GNAT superfamily N-acetyltransferase
MVPLQASMANVDATRCVTMVPDVREVSAASDDALAMIARLSARLAEITGDPGRNSFADWREGDARHVFVVAYDDGVPVGCGALRELGDGVGELKRMYAARAGVGSAVLAHLEGVARARGLVRLVLETRAVNVVAVRFYEKRGYWRVDNYGRYVGRAEAVCFGKVLE